MLQAAADLDGTLIDVEGRLVQLLQTGTGQDAVRWPVKVMGRLAYLAEVVASADFPPPDQHREVQAVLEERLRSVESEYESVLATEVADFNRMLRELELSPVISEQP